MNNRFIFFCLIAVLPFQRQLGAEEGLDAGSTYALEAAEALAAGRELLDEWLESDSAREVLEREGPRLRRRFVFASEEEQLRIGAVLSALAATLAESFPAPAKDWEQKEPHGFLYPPGVRLFLEEREDVPPLDLLLLEGYCMKAMSMIMLDMLYFQGIQTAEGAPRLPPYHPEILKFWKTLAEEGLPRGLWVMGKAHLHGLGVEQNTEKALQLLAHADLEEAWMELAMHFYLQGDATQARAWWRFAALETDNPVAWYSLGISLMHAGKFAETVQALRNCLNADPEFHPARIELARCYMEGWGVEVDDERAEELLREVLATDRRHLKSHPYADILLGELYRRRRQPGMDENRERFDRLRRGAAASDPRAMREFALMLTGQFAGIDARPEVGLHWLRRAADAGDSVAQRTLALMLIHGTEEMAADPEQGLTLLQAAAASGDGDARFRLASLYFEGVHVPENPEKARAQYRKLAEEGLEVAMLYLGMRLWEGRGFPKDLAEARIWLRRGAEKGSADGMKLYVSFLIEENLPEKNALEIYVFSTLAIRAGKFSLHPVQEAAALQLSGEEWARAREEVEERFRALEE